MMMLVFCIADKHIQYCVGWLYHKGYMKCTPLLPMSTTNVAACTNWDMYGGTIKHSPQHLQHRRLSPAVAPNVHDTLYTPRNPLLKKHHLSDPRVIFIITNKMNPVLRNMFAIEYWNYLSLYFNNNIAIFNY